jgi:hypothetical protein
MQVRQGFLNNFHVMGKLLTSYVMPGICYTSHLKLIRDFCISQTISVPLAVHVNTLTWSSVMASILGNAVSATVRRREAVALCGAAGEEGKPMLANALSSVASGARVISVRVGGMDSTTLPMC